MKRLWCAPLFFLYSFSISAVPVDKYAHFGAGFASNYACTVLANKVVKMPKSASMIFCFAAVNSAAVAKEGIDHRQKHNRFNGTDMAATSLGATMALLLSFVDGPPPLPDLLAEPHAP